MDTRDRRTDFYERARTRSPFLVADTEFGQFIVPSEGGGATSRSVFIDREHHPQLLAMRAAVRVLRRKDRSQWPTGLHMLDVGAGLGLRCISALSEFGFSKAVAFESDAELALLIRMSARLNDCHRRIRVGPVSACADRRLTEHDDGENVTLDEMAHRGLFDPSCIGLLWIGASEPASGVLNGAQTLIHHRVPIVIEVGPALRTASERETLVATLQDSHPNARFVGRRAGSSRSIEALRANAPPVGSHLLFGAFD